MKRILLLFFIGFLSLQLQAQSGAKVNNSSSIKVYPNPTTDYIAVSDKNERVAHLVVYNLIGRKLDSFKVVSDKKYDISYLPKGLYLVQLLDKKNKVITTKRVSKR